MIAKLRALPVIRLASDLYGFYSSTSRTSLSSLSCPATAGRPSANVSREAERNGDGTGSSRPRATDAAGGSSGEQAGPGPDRLARRLADLPRRLLLLPPPGAGDPDLPAVHRLDGRHRRQQPGLRADLPGAVLRRGAGGDHRDPDVVGVPGAQGPPARQPRDLPRRGGPPDRG